MNLGQAVAVSLYELARDSQAGSAEESGAAPSSPQARLASTVEGAGQALAGDVERITAVLLDALRASGYLKPDSAAPTEEKMRRLVRRLDLSAGDAEVWLGMLRQMVWKMRSRE